MEWPPTLKWNPTRLDRFKMFLYRRVFRDYEWIARVWEQRRTNEAVEDSEDLDYDYDYSKPGATDMEDVWKFALAVILRRVDTKRRNYDEGVTLAVGGFMSVYSMDCMYARAWEEAILYQDGFYEIVSNGTY